MDFKRIVFLLGPTAVGKTGVSFHLARGLNAEIISCDSMQVYKEISIASGKPPEEILRKVPHHLVGVVSIQQEFDVMTFQQMALAAIKKIHAENKIPLVVGGSGLYVQVLLDGLFAGVPQDSQLRGKLDWLARKRGNEFLFAQLQAWDPHSAQKIHPHDRKRIIRALEVYLTTREPMSRWQKRRQGLWGSFDISLFALNRERPQLYQSINDRVEQMFHKGVVNEIKRFQKVPWSRTAQAIIGVREIRGFLEGKHTLQKAKELMRLHTRRYAKRQMTWFRKEKRLCWITIELQETPQQVASRIMERLSR